MYDVVIVGAGPVGCRVGELLGKKGLKVLVLEEHSEIGKPVQCAGLVSHRIFDLSGVSKDVVVNVVKKARIFSIQISQLLLDTSLFSTMAIFIFCSQCIG